MSLIGFLTVAEAASVLNVVPTRVYALLNSNRIVGARRFGNTWAIPREIMITAPNKPGARYTKICRGRRVKLQAPLS